MEDYNSIHPGPDIDQGVSDALPGGRLDQAITAAIETAVSRAVAQLAAKYHASQHAADGADPITPAAIGALALTGGDISGHVNMAKRLQVPYFVQTSLGTPNELGQYLDMHMAGSSADYDLRLFLDSNKKLYAQRTGEAAQKVLTTADFDASGAAKILTGTYEGADAHGPKYPCTIECGFAPKAAIVFSLNEDNVGDDNIAIFIHGQNGMMFGANYVRDIDYGWNISQMTSTTWGKTSLSWYAGTTSSGYEDGDTQMNADQLYGYMVWG